MDNWHAKTFVRCRVETDNCEKRRFNLFKELYFNVL